MASCSCCNKEKPLVVDAEYGPMCADCAAGECDCVPDDYCEVCHKQAADIECAHGLLLRNSLPNY